MNDGCGNVGGRSRGRLYGHLVSVDRAQSCGLRSRGKLKSARAAGKIDEGLSTVFKRCGQHKSTGSRSIWHRMDQIEAQPQGVSASKISGARCAGTGQERLLKEFIERGLIEPSDSKWASPAFIVLKKEKGEWRLFAHWLPAIRLGPPGQGNGGWWSSIKG